MEIAPTAEKDPRTRVLATAFDLFARYGVKSISMDDIARELGMSKRTLYVHFADKEELLIASLLHNITEMKNRGRDISRRTETVLHTILEFYKEMIPQIQHYSPRFREEIRKHPRAMEVLREGRAQQIEEIRGFYAEGVRQGVFLPSVDYELFTCLVIGMTDLKMDDPLLRRFTMTDIHTAVMLAAVRSIATDRGRCIFDSFAIENQWIKNNTQE